MVSISSCVPIFLFQLFHLEAMYRQNFTKMQIVSFWDQDGVKNKTHLSQIVNQMHYLANLGFQRWAWNINKDNTDLKQAKQSFVKLE